jgi:hypothetical protein
MEAANKTNMDAMMEQMNALVAAGGAQRAHQPDKENTPPGRNVIPLGGGNRVRKPRQKKALCPNCIFFVLHKLANCYELKEDKGIALPRMEVYICRLSNCVIGTGDLTIRFRISSS